MKILGQPTQEQRDKLASLIDGESWFALSEADKNRLLDHGVVLELRAGEELISAGNIDTNIYIVVDGVMRNWFWDGGMEKTSFFCTDGTVFISYHGFAFAIPAPNSWEACCPTRVFMLDRETFMSLIDASHDFSRWFLGNAYMQLAFVEKKSNFIQGKAYDRYMSLVRNRPEIIKNVSLKNIASYLGITPQHLSYIRRKVKI